VTCRPQRELALRGWTWRIGGEAAGHRIAFDTWMIRAGSVSIVGFLLAITGGMIHQPMVWGLGLAVLVVWPILFAFAAVELRRLNKAIRSALGIRIDMRSHPGPPRGSDRYVAWCCRYGLQPYPFKPSEPECHSNSEADES